MVINTYIHITATSVGRGNGRHSADAAQMLRPSASVTRFHFQEVCIYSHLW